MAKDAGNTISTKTEIKDIQKDYAKELAEYRESVKLRAGVYYLPAYREHLGDNGNIEKILPATYHPENDVEKLKYEYFFEIVGYDKRICEQILNPKAMSLRLALADYSIIDLMIEYKKRELNILSTSLGVLDASDKQKTV